MFNLTQLLADPTPSPATGGGGGLLGNSFMFIMLGGLVVVFILMNRRNKKSQAKTADFRQSLDVGQRVMTVGGMVGLVTQVNGDVLTLESASGDQTEYVRRAIRELVDDDMWDNMTQPYPTDDEVADDAAATEDVTDDNLADDGDDDDQDPPAIEQFGSDKDK